MTLFLSLASYSVYTCLLVFTPFLPSIHIYDDYSFTPPSRLGIQETIYHHFQYALLLLVEDRLTSFNDYHKPFTCVDKAHNIITIFLHIEKADILKTDMEEMMYTCENQC